MEDNGKEYIKFKLAATFRIILKRKKDLQIQNKANEVEDVRLVASLRKLEAESGLSYNIIQGVFSGNRELHFTTLISLIENLDISFSKFAELYDSISEKQISNEIRQIELNKRKLKNKKH